MILSRHTKRGILDISLPGHQKKLHFVDFASDNTVSLDAYAGWRAKALSPDAKKIALTRSSDYKRAERTDLVIMTVDDQKVQLNTHDYYVYDVAFDARAATIILVTSKKKPFCYSLELNQIVAELPGPVRTYKGDLDLQLNTFFAPCENRKDTLYAINFNTGQTQTIPLGVNERISQVKFSADLSALYAITDANVFYRFDRNYELVWSANFDRLGRKDGRINSSGIFSTEDGRYLCLSVSATTSNVWGIDYVIDSETGEIVKRVEGYQFRGRIAGNFFGNKVLLYTLQTLDLTTGETSKNPIINLT